VGFGKVQALTAEMEANDWTNPLCHSKSWERTDAGRPAVYANDRDRARVLKVVVPLVIPDPAHDQQAAYQISYCDAGSQVGTSRYLNAQAPYGNTRPMVVGFIEANIFDFNFTWTKNSGSTMQGSQMDSVVGGRQNGKIPDFSPVGGEPSGHVLGSGHGNLPGSGDSGEGEPEEGDGSTPADGTDESKGTGGHH